MVTENGDSNSGLSGTVSRRTFLDLIVQGSLAVTFIGILSAVASYIWPPRSARSAGAAAEMDAGSVEDIAMGKAKKVAYKEGTLVIRTSGGFVALSAICTHLGCMLNWDEDKQVIVCPCHGALFDVKGNVLAGPAPKPLPEYKLTIANNRIYVGG
jgi:cytochrome b6-f complex iron-sulfur subunit